MTDESVGGEVGLNLSQPLHIRWAIGESPGTSRRCRRRSGLEGGSHLLRIGTPVPSDEVLEDV